MFEVSYCNEGGDTLSKRDNPIFTYLAMDAVSIVDYSTKENLDDGIVDSLLSHDWSIAYTYVLYFFTFCIHYFPFRGGRSPSVPINDSTATRTPNRMLYHSASIFSVRASDMHPMDCT